MQLLKTPLLFDSTEWERADLSNLSLIPKDPMVTAGRRMPFIRLRGGLWAVGMGLGQVLPIPHWEYVWGGLGLTLSGVCANGPRVIGEPSVLQPYHATQALVWGSHVRWPG